MSYDNQKNSFVETPLDTLAQLSPEHQDTLTKRAKSKFLSNSFVLKLVDVPNSKLTKSYWNTYHCSREIKQDGQKITAKYCNHRWCLVCNRIRTAKLINGYYKPLQELKDKQFVTLTIKSMNGDSLHDAICLMNEKFRVICKRLHKQEKKVTGIRKIEVTHNPIKGFHPHYHCIIEGEEVANLLVENWLKEFPEPLTKRKAQDIKKADENSVLELFKYFTKLLPSKSKKSKKLQPISATALDTIFTAMEGKRVFQPIGVKKEVSEEIDNLESKIYEELESDFATWTFHAQEKQGKKVATWINHSNGKHLVDCEIEKKAQELANKIVV